MSGNRQGSGLQVANLQYQPRVSNCGSGSKGGMYNNKFSRMSRTEDRPDPRQVSGATSCSSSSGSWAAARSKSPQTTAKANLPRLSGSLTDEKFHHVPLLPGCRNVMNCFSGSSDDSGSDTDIEIGLDVNRGHSIFPIATDVAFRRRMAASCQGNTSASTSSQSLLLSCDTNMRKGNAGILSGRLGNQTGEKLNWDEHHGYLASDVETSRGAGSSTFPYGPTVLEETELPCSSVMAPNISLMASQLNGCQCGNETSSSTNGAMKEKLGAEISCNCKIGNNGSGFPNLLHGKGITDKASSYFRGLNVDRQDFTCKRRNCTQGLLGHKPVGTASSRLGFRGSNVATTSSRRNFSDLSCSSSSDVLPSVPASSFVDNPDWPRCVKAVGPNSTSNKSEALRDLRSGKSPVSAIALGCLAYRNSRDGSGGSSTERSSSEVDSVAVRPIRRSGTAFQSEVWCPRSVSSMEHDTTNSSGTSIGIDGKSPLSSRGCRGGSPLFSRGRTMTRSSGRLGEHVFGTAVASSESPSLRYAASRSRVTSAGSCYANQFGMGLEIRNPIRSRTDSGSLSSSMGSFTLDDQDMPSSSTFSGPPPSRPPPPPPALVSNQQYGSYNPPPLSSPYISNPHLPQSYTASSDRNHLSNTPFGPRFTRLVPPSEDQYERQSLLCRPSHEAQVQSVGESQPRLMMEGLSEIITALEHVERDEELSYEQILMLEATILLGGMGLHDRYRDMRLDVDNMSYEELLALEERIGSVSTGLSDDAIDKCLKRSRYTSLNVSINYVPQEVEVKCSVCQEEFVENVDLGILECGHSYHVACIKQWLLQKNQCPICKASTVSQL